MNTQPLSKNQLKEYRALKQSKFRKSSGLFIAEGVRLCQDLLDTEIQLEAAVTPSGFDTFELPRGLQTFTATSVQMEQLSDSRNPQDVIFICRIPAQAELPKPNSNQIILCLDRISDPGNLGTLLRTARWFGVETVLLSSECADPYNPKVVRASMGAVGSIGMRTQVDLDVFCQEWQSMGGRAFALDMEGSNIRELENQQPALIVVGSEAHGISPELRETCQTITIPGSGSAESLNAAMAAGIALWELSV